MNFDDLDLDVLRHRVGEKWNTYGPDVLPAWVADMDFPQCEAVREMLAERIATGDLGYPTDGALVDLRRAFIARAADRFDWSVDEWQVEPITDVMQGIYGCLLTLTTAAAGVVAQTPVYPPFLHAPAACQRRLMVSPLARGNDGYEIDLDHLRRCCDDGAEILLLCNPQNPTGRAFTRGELTALAEIAVDRNLLVCSDEIHADLIFPGSRHIPFATIAPEVARQTVTLMSATKAFNIAGLRCAMAVFGSEETKNHFSALPPHARGGIGALGIDATVLAWQQGQGWLDDVLAYLERNRELVSHFASKHLGGAAFAPPQATYLAWLDCRSLDLPPSPYGFFLDRAKVALSDGSGFGEAGRGFVRLNFATSRPILEQILGQLAAALTS